MSPDPAGPSGDPVSPGDPVPSGALILVATPIGNLGDISARAAEVLKTVPVIGCEDTRRTGRLLEHLGVDRSDGVPRLLVINEATEQAAIDEVLSLLAQNKSVALVSDAGTPGVADPGTSLVAAAAAAGHQVTIAPGASAPIAALAISGLAVLPHVMEGWLPRKGEARRERISQICAERRTVVILESPHRIVSTLAELAEAQLASASNAERPCVVVRELTKLHEEVVRSTLGEVAEIFAPSGTAAAASATPTAAPKGEFVIILGPQAAPIVSDEEITQRLLAALSSGQRPRTAAKLVSQQLAVPRNRVYEIVLRL